MREKYKLNTLPKVFLVGTKHLVLQVIEKLKWKGSKTGEDRNCIELYYVLGSLVYQTVKSLSTYCNDFSSGMDKRKNN